ncbi:TPA: transporter [Legionella pneumophila]|nr:transporter [Legionella pneumophila]HAU1107061.1 transporter [Legionella pneumophila]
MDMKCFILSSLFTRSAQILFLFLASISLVIASEHPVSQVIIPATVPEIFQEIDEYNLALYKILENNQLHEVHYHVFAVLKLVNALPNVSHHLSSTQLKMLQKNIASIRQLVIQMDKSSITNDKKSTQAHFETLRKILDELHTYYSIKKHVQ